MDDVYVVEVAATGPKGYPNDSVAEIAVCRVFGDGSDFETVYNDGVFLDPKDLGKDPLDYMQANHGIEPEDLYAGSDISRVVEDFQKAVFGKECTSYNVGSTFGRFLSFEPWDSARELTILPSISVRLPPELKGPPEKEHELIRLAYSSLCPGDPACVGDGMHAIHLAQMASSVLMELRRRGLARSSHHSEERGVDDQIREGGQVEDRVDHEKRHGQHPRDQRDYEREDDRRDEEDQSDDEEHRSPLVASAEQLTHAQQSEQAEDGAEDQGDLAVRPLRLLGLNGFRLVVRRDLLVAFGAGHAVGRDELSAERAAPVGHSGSLLRRFGLFRGESADGGVCPIHGG